MGSALGWREAGDARSRKEGGMPNGVPEASRPSKHAFLHGAGEPHPQAVVGRKVVTILFIAGFAAR
jgi:hypothetical protein